MDLALLAIITALVLILQIITLVLIAGTRKSITGLKTAPQTIPPSIDRDRPRGRDNEFRRHDRRPFHDQKQRPQPQPQSQPQLQHPTPAGTSPAPADEGIEKSLRDINLRLKNAERDQESARRRLQENMPRDQQRNRDDRNRDDRDRGRPRGGRDRNDRYGNRDGNRGNWQDRQGNRDRQDRPMAPAQQSQATPATVAAAPVEESLFETKNPLVLERAAPVQEAPIPANIQDPSPVDYVSEEGVQHGRKIIVKRRPLSSDDSSDASSQNSGDSPSSAPTASSNPEEETTVSGSDATDAQIKFGRR